MKPRHILPLLVIALAVLSVGLYAFIERREISIRLSHDSDARAHNVRSISLRDAEGREIKNGQTEEFNKTLNKVVEGCEMRFSLAKYQSMAGPWIILGGILTAYSLFMLYKLKSTKPNPAP